MVLVGLPETQQGGKADCQISYDCCITFGMNVWIQWSMDLRTCYYNLMSPKHEELMEQMKKLVTVLISQL